MLFSPQELPQQQRLPAAPSPLPPRADRSVTPTIERLRPLLDAAANLDLADREGWQRLHETSRAVIAVLVAGDRLPRHLEIRADDPPMLVARTLTAAWQHATNAWPQRQHRC